MSPIRCPNPGSVRQASIAASLGQGPTLRNRSGRSRSRSNHARVAPCVDRLHSANSSPAAANSSLRPGLTIHVPLDQTSAIGRRSYGRVDRMPVRTVIEHGTKDKRSVAFSLDWPGWSRGAKSAELALETLESYRQRYRPVAELAGMSAEVDRAGPLEIVEDRVGTGSTDFWGISVSPSSTQPRAMKDAGAEP